MADLIKQIQEFEESLRDNPELYKEIILNSACVIIVNIENGLIVHSTPAAESVFGYEMVGELKGMNINDLIPERFHEAHKGHLSKYLERPTKRTMGERPHGGGQIKLIGKTRDGIEFPVELGLDPRKIFGKSCVVVTILKSRQ